MFNSMLFNIINPVRFTCLYSYLIRKSDIRSFQPVYIGVRLSSTNEVKKPNISIALQTIPESNIRNFSIIAHIDHGKSTLSDRLLELTGTIVKSKNNEQVLDKLQVERERGITVKAQTASMIYSYQGQDYLFNLIDTPGHVDFSYEVSRSLSACQGAVLLVDANRGVQAQTVANYNLATSNSLSIIPVINKIDLKNAKPEAAANQITKLFNINSSEILKVSAKEGTGCNDLLNEIVKRIPPPPGKLSEPFRGLLFDSWYDKYRGVIILVAVMDGCVKLGDEVYSSTNQAVYQVRDLGVLSPDEKKTAELKAGHVGYLVLNMRKTKDAKIGDTIHHKGASVKLLPVPPPAKPMVFAGIYPEDQTQHQLLRTSIEKLTLTDNSVEVKADSSPALGQGWRFGFLGLLHMEVFSQRLDQEFNVQVVVTAPNVPYKAKIFGAKNIKEYGREELLINNPSQFPDLQIVSEFQEPMVLATIILPEQHLEKVTSLCTERRGEMKSKESIDGTNLLVKWELPLSEVIIDFFDDLKSATSGFASFDYVDIDYKVSDIKKVTFLLNGKAVEELSLIVHASRVESLSRKVCLKLKESIPRQQYEVAIQASLGKKILARETLKALRKDVLAKCYGGDVTRKMKLLKNQAEGKKKLRMIGSIGVPRDAFINVLKK